MEKTTPRDAFWTRLYEIAKADRNVILVSADMGAPSLDAFRRDLSSQYVNVGIAEQNAVLVAAGLSMQGKKVFAYAIAPFITLRPFEQSKVTLAAMKLPVTLVGVGAGFSYDDSGPTHHTLEDIAMLRLLPGFEVNNMTDSIMAEAFADRSCHMNHPNYIRLDRKILPHFYNRGYDFSQGFSVLRKPGEIMIVATGNMVESAMRVARQLERKSILAGVMDVYTFPISEEPFVKALKGVRRLVTIEEHILTGGLGSAVCDVLAGQDILLPCKRIGVDLAGCYCYQYGGREQIQKTYSLDVKSIVAKIAAWMR